MDRNPKTQVSPPSHSFANARMNCQAKSKAQRKWSKVINGNGAVAWQRAKFFLVWREVVWCVWCNFIYPGSDAVGILVMRVISMTFTWHLPVVTHL